VAVISSVDEMKRIWLIALKTVFPLYNNRSKFDYLRAQAFARGIITRSTNVDSTNRGFWAKQSYMMALVAFISSRCCFTCKKSIRVKYSRKGRSSLSTWRCYRERGNGR
jgi:hypothetical protein